MALAAGTGYLVNLIYYASIGTLKMVDLIPVPSLVELTSLMGTWSQHFQKDCHTPDVLPTILLEDEL